MKTFLIAGLITLNAFVLNVIGQTPATQWQKAIGGTGCESAYSIQSTTDGGYIIAGSSNSINGDLLGVPGNSVDDCWVLKLAANGTIEWQKKYGSSNIDVANDIKQTADGGYIMAGRTSANMMTDGDVTTGSGGWLVKLTPTGAIEWQANVGQNGNSVHQTSDGDFVVGGNNFVRKYTSAGSLSWNRNFSYSIKAIHPTSDGGIVATGEATTFRRLDIMIAKLNSSGVVESENDFGTLGYEGSTTILQTTDGGYIVAGYAVGEGSDHVPGYKGGTDAWILKLDQNMDTVWSKAVGGTGNDYIRKIIQVNDGYVIAGETSSTDGDISNHHGGFWDAWAFKLGNNGDLVWQKNFGGTANDIFYGITQSTDGGYMLAGHTYSTDGDVTGQHGGGCADLWAVKISADESLPITFGAVDAVIKNGELHVNWTSQSEINNAYYLVEVSADGKNFTTISDQILTKAKNGNSDTPLQYHFTKSYTAIHVLVMLFLGLSFGFNTRKRLLLTGFMVIGGALFVLSCNKNTNDIQYDRGQKLYLRIAQADKDGATSYSRIISVVPQ